MKKRVLSIIHYPVFGGPYNRNIKLAPLLLQKGYETVMLIPDEPGTGRERLQEAGIPLHTCSLSRVRATKDLRIHLRYLREFWRDVHHIRQYIRSECIELVQINGLANSQSAVAARLEGVPVVWQILDSYTPMALRLLLLPVMRWAATVVMCTGKSVAEGHPGIQAFCDRLVYFFPPVDLDAFSAVPGGQVTARQLLGLPIDAPVVGTVGNVNRQKGHLRFVEAAAAIRARRSDVRFVILGGAHQNQASFMATVIDRVKREGFEFGKDFIICDPGSDVPRLAQAFDVFWMTSEPYSEGIPTAIEEAMALGIPVVSTDVGSVREIVSSGRTGFLVHPRDVQGMAARTLELIANSSIRAEMGREAIRSAEQFSAERCAERHFYAYEMALAAQRKSPSRTVAP